MPLPALPKEKKGNSPQLWCLDRNYVIGCDDPEDPKCPMRIGRLETFVAVTEKPKNGSKDAEGEVSFIGMTTGQIFHSKWKGLEYPLTCTDDDIAGKKVYKAEVFRRVEADVSTDRTNFRPGPVIGTILSAQGPNCYVRMEKSFLESDYFNTGNWMGMSTGLPKVGTRVQKKNGPGEQVSEGVITAVDEKTGECAVVTVAEWGLTQKMKRVAAAKEKLEIAASGSGGGEGEEKADQPGVFTDNGGVLFLNNSSNGGAVVGPLPEGADLKANIEPFIGDLTEVGKEKKVEDEGLKQVSTPGADDVAHEAFTAPDLVKLDSKGGDAQPAIKDTKDTDEDPEKEAGAKESRKPSVEVEHTLEQKRQSTLKIKLVDGMDKVMGLLNI